MGHLYTLYQEFIIGSYYELLTIHRAGTIPGTDIITVGVYSGTETETDLT